MTDKPAESAVERWERQYGPGSYGRALNWMACSNVFNSIDAALAELLDAIERLKCCGNCGDCVDPDDDGVFWCEEDTYLAIRGDEPCNFTPSRWTERGAE